ncbi:DUF2459 domain-containing protein [Antarcticibacterium flavum]|uniref:DUF2459 domain-containing protein n=1 Tax=Antarcticibacterium flavum TaxID=2058175 RepID=A0A5B7X7D1_9FLAO|nr:MULTISPECIES: DUF2459 domain-containing protein [Antarcticibacterium]MCM4159749.1 hypothetical protein [Antarcticibacterium sp. W02-3]QCY70682.1 DUF2459 domain-containing protein [Antarcticibacterium flavum]
MHRLDKIPLLCLFLLLFLPAKAWQQPNEKHSIYVSSISWHTGIIVPAATFPESIWPPEINYKNAAWLEIGWGDMDFFSAKGFNPWHAIKAAFWPTSSAMQIKPIYGPVETAYSNTNLAKLKIDKEQLDKLRNYLLRELKLNEDAKLIPVTAGPSNSYFFKGSSSYYFPKNSNVWVAKALKETGFSLTPIWYQTTGKVVRKAGEFGELVMEKD